MATNNCVPIARRAPPMRGRGEKSWQSVRRFFFEGVKIFGSRRGKVVDGIAPRSAASALRGN